MMNKIKHSLLHKLYPSLHYLECSFFRVLDKWDTEYIKELELEYQSRLYQSKLLRAKYATFEREKEDSCVKIAKDRYEYLLYNHNENVIELIYDNYPAFKYGYTKSNVQSKRYDLIIEKIDYLKLGKMSRENIVYNCNKNLCDQSGALKE